MPCIFAYDYLVSKYDDFFKGLILLALLAEVNLDDLFCFVKSINTVLYLEPYLIGDIFSVRNIYFLDTDANILSLYYRIDGSAFCPDLMK